MQRIVIYGTGGMGREMAEWIRRYNEVKQSWDLLGFLDRSKPTGATQGFRVLGDVDWYDDTSNRDTACVVAVGDPRVRREIVKDLSTRSVKYATIADPSLLDAPGIKIGAGSIICPGAVVTIDVTIGEHVIVNANSSIMHDVVLGDFVSVFTGCQINGNVTIETGATIGSGTVFVPGTSMGAWSVTGAQAAITRDIGPGLLAVGVPARPIKRYEQGEWIAITE